MAYSMGYMGRDVEVIPTRMTRMSNEDKIVIKQIFDKHMGGKTWRTRGDKFIKTQKEVLEKLSRAINARGVSGNSQMIEIYYTYTKSDGRPERDVLFTLDRGQTVLEINRIKKYGTATPTGDDVARSMGYDIKMTNRSGETIYTTPQSIKTTTEGKAISEGVPIDIALQKKLSENKVTDLSGNPISPLSMKKRIAESMDKITTKTADASNKAKSLPVLVFAGLVIIAVLIFGITHGRR